MAAFYDWIAYSSLGQVAPMLAILVTLLVYLCLFGAAAAAFLLLAASVLWAATRVHPLLDAKLWQPAVKAFAFFSAGASTKTWAVFGYFSLWFVGYYLYALKAFSGASWQEIASKLTNVGIQAIYALPYLLIFAIFVFTYKKWNRLSQAAERRWPKAALFARRVLKAVRFLLWGWMATRWGAGLLTALAGFFWLSLWFAGYFLPVLKAFSRASLPQIASKLTNVGIQAIHALPYLLVFAIFVFTYRKWNGLRQAAERRWPRAAPFALRVLEVVRFFLWGWMGTRWGAGLLTAFAGLFWLSYIMQALGGDLGDFDVRWIMAAAITVPCFIIAIALGIGLSGLHAGLEAQGKQERLNVMRTYFSFGIIVLLCAVELWGVWVFGGVGPEALKVTAYSVIQGSLLTAALFLTLAAPFGLGWRLQPAIIA